MSTLSSQPNRTKQQAPDLITLAECARRYWWVAVVCGCVFAAMGAAAGQFGVPARFKAAAMVQLSGPNGIVERPRETSTAQREFRNTQQELIRMPHVLQRALESPEVTALGEIGSDPDSVDELRDWLQLELPRSSEILRIGVQHNRADLAYLLANAVTDAYLQEAYRASAEELDSRLATLDRLQKTTEERLAKAWSDLQALAHHLGSGDPTALSLQAQAEIENYRDYARRLRELRAERREAERLIRSIQQSPEMLSKEMPEDSMHSVRFAMFQAKLEKERALRQWGPNHPDVTAAAQEENLLREYYQKTASDEGQQPESREEEMLAKPLATIARLSNEEQALEGLIREIEDRMQVLGGDNATKLEILRNDIARMERLSDRLWQTRENLQVERHADQRVQLVSYATLPSQRDTSKRVKLTLLLTVGGFGFAVFVIALGEFLTGRVHSLRDATKRTGLKLLGSLPKLPPTLDCETTEDTKRQAKVQAKMDLLVARLVHHPLAENTKTIMVTGARRKRERERLAAHIAAALARTGNPTVLVELDLRDTEVKVDFPRTSDKGVVEVVRAGDGVEHTKTISVDELKLATGMDNLDFLPAGDAVVEPLPILTHHRLAELIDTLQQSYTFVILDTAGVLQYPDALHLSRFADVSVLSIQHNISTSASVTQAENRLEEIGLVVFGMMIA